MSFTDKYVFVNTESAVAIDLFSFRLDLGSNNERVPYVLVEALSASLASTEMTDVGYTVKCEEIALNYFSGDRKGSTLATLDFNANLPGAIDNRNVFHMTGATQLVLGGQTRFLTVFVEDIFGEKQTITNLIPFSLLLKLKYPVVGAIEASYRQQIPL